MSRNLRRICAVNIKKSAGGSVSDDGNVMEGVDVRLLNKQLALYSAQFIICCGDVVSKAIIHNCIKDKRKWLFDFKLKTTNMAVWRQIDNGAFLIEFRHPQQQGHYTDQYLFETLMDVVRRCKEYIDNEKNNK